MDSAYLLGEDKLASIRRRNKFLIIIFFSLIIALALITGRSIASLVQQINSKSPKSNRAIREFCSPFKFRSACVDSIISAIKPPPHANPNQIFLLSLESSLTKISSIISAAPSELAQSNCSSSLTHAASQLDSILEMLRIDPDVESYDRRDMTAWIGAAAADLAACGAVGDVAAVVRYGRDFLLNCDVVNAQFAWRQEEDYRSLRDEAFENLMGVVLFGLPQYIVLIFLFCLLLRVSYLKRN